MNKNFKFLLIGCGKIARLHTRILKFQLFQQNISCYDIDKKIESSFIKEFSIKKFNQNQQYDAILICSPTDVHLDSVEEFKNFGNFFFIEKPIVNTLEEYNKLQELINPDKLYCGLIELHNQIFEKLINLVNIDEILSIQIVRHSPEIVSDRVTSHAHMDLAIHDVSLLLKYFINFNEIQKFEIIKNYLNKTFFETAEILLQDKKINVNLSISRKTNIKIRTWRIVTISKTYVVDLISNSIITYDTDSLIKVDANQFTQKINEEINSYTIVEPAENQMKYFIQCMNNGTIDKTMIEIINNSHKLLFD